MYRQIYSPLMCQIASVDWLDQIIWNLIINVVEPGSNALWPLEGTRDRVMSLRASVASSDTGSCCIRCDKPTGICQKGWVIDFLFIYLFIVSVDMCNHDNSQTQCFLSGSHVKSVWIQKIQQIQNCFFEITFSSRKHTHSVSFAVIFQVQCFSASFLSQEVLT